MLGESCWNIGQSSAFPQHTAGASPLQRVFTTGNTDLGQNAALVECAGYSTHSIPSASYEFFKQLCVPSVQIGAIADRLKKQKTSSV